MKNVRKSITKIFIGIAAIMFIGVSFCAAQVDENTQNNVDSFKNNLFKIDIYKTTDNEINAVLYMTNAYPETIHVLEKENNEYVILIPEVKTSLVENPDIKILGELLNAVVIETQPFSETPPLSGYTKITFVAKSPIKIKTSLEILKLPDINIAQEEMLPLINTTKNIVAKTVAPPPQTVQIPKKTVAKLSTPPVKLNTNPTTVKRAVYKKTTVTYRRPPAPQVSSGVYKTATTTAIKPTPKPPVEEPVMSVPKPTEESVSKEVAPAVTTETEKAETQQPQAEAVSEELKPEQPMAEQSIEEQLLNAAQGEPESQKKIPLKLISLILGILLISGGLTYLTWFFLVKNKKQEQKIPQEINIEDVISDDDFSNLQIPSEQENLPQQPDLDVNSSQESFETIAETMPNEATINDLSVQNVSEINSDVNIAEETEQNGEYLEESDLENLLEQEFKQAPDIVEDISDLYNSETEPDIVENLDFNPENSTEISDEILPQISEPTLETDGSWADNFENLSQPDISSEIKSPEDLFAEPSEILPSPEKATINQNFENSSVIQQQAEQMEIAKPKLELVKEDKTQTLSAPQQQIQPKIEASVTNLNVQATVDLNNNKSLHLIEFGGKTSLVGTINDEIFVLKKFDTLKNNLLQTRLYEETTTGSTYMVKSENYKALVDVKDNEIKLSAEL